MSRIVKKRCNGPNRHENEFKCDDLLQKVRVTRDGMPRSGDLIDLPAEVVMRCRFCVEGRVVFIRAELERISQ